jgi:hypothetical protein
MIMDGTEKLLQAIEAFRDEARVRDEKNEARFEEHGVKLDAHGAKLDAHGAALSTLTAEVARHASQLFQLSEAQVGVAKSSAYAAELAARAMTMASTASDDTRKMVESAMVIQKDAIAGVVREVVAPVVTEIETLRANDAAVTATLENQDTQLANVVRLLSTLARWQNHWAVKAGIALAGLIGAGIAGYFGARGH